MKDQEQRTPGQPDGAKALLDPADAVWPSEESLIGAIALGASGVQMGTVFLSCEESGASPNHRKTLLTREAGKTALTRGFTGRLARGIKNQLLDELSQKETEILPYPLQRALVRHLSILAEKAGLRELLPLWAGQSARLSHGEDVNVLLSNLVTQVSGIAESVQRWGAARSSQSQPEAS